jgi:hypothetical protein
MRVLEPIMMAPSNGEEKIVHYPKGNAWIKRKQLDCLLKKSGKEAYLNDEVSIQENLHLLFMISSE